MALDRTRVVVGKNGNSLVLIRRFWPQVDPLDILLEDMPIRSCNCQYRHGSALRGVVECITWEERDSLLPGTPIDAVNENHIVGVGIHLLNHHVAHACGFREIEIGKLTT